LDYIAAVYDASEVDPGTTGWTVKLLDHAGATIFTGNAPPQTIEVAGDETRQRVSLQVFAETDVVQLEISWDYTTPAPVMLSQELYDAYIEYTPAQNTGGF
jgi:hypothetical protein